jgi:hypothetical protein
LPKTPSITSKQPYCNQEVITSCLAVGAKFTITANQATSGWENHIPEITAWEPWSYSKEEKKKAAESGQELPEVEVGRFFWRPSWNEVLCFPVVVKRTRGSGQLSLLEGDWKHYGVVTNLSLVNRTLQSVIEFHNERGNVENFIREEKYGYDLKHFPCLELNANRAFAMIAMAAHNLLRWAAIHENPWRPRFAKGFRARFVHIPGIVVKHARAIVLRVSEAALKEVNRLRRALELKPFESPATAGCPAG